MKSVLLITLTLLLISCGGGSKIVKTDRKVSEIKKLAMFEPIAVVLNKSGGTDSLLNEVTKLHVTKVVDKLFPMSVEIYDLDVPSDMKPTLTVAFYMILTDMSNDRKDRIEKYLPGIISLMEKGGIDYVLAVSQIGDTGHNKDQPANSQSFAAIFDREKKNIAYYGFSGSDPLEPTEETTTEYQFSKVLKGLFETK